MAKLTKLEMRKSRLKILAEIDRLDKLRCSFCHLDSGYTPVKKSRCKCDSAIKVHALGIKLNKLVSPRKTVELEVIAIPDLTGVTTENLTVEMYEQLKRARLRDIDIWRLLGIGGTRFRRWKDANGVSNKSGVKS